MSDFSVVVVDPRLPFDRLMFENIDTSQKPTYTVGEIAKFFFGKSTHWVRWRENKNFFVLGGDPLCAHGIMVVPEGAVPDGGFDRSSQKFISALENGVCTRCGGVAVGKRRKVTAKGDVGSRIYDLADIEKMAHALAQRGALDRAQLTNALMTVQVQGKIWGYL